MQMKRGSNYWHYQFFWNLSFVHSPNSYSPPIGLLTLLILLSYRFVVKILTSLSISLSLLISHIVNFLSVFFNRNTLACFISLTTFGTVTCKIEECVGWPIDSLVGNLPSVSVKISSCLERNLFCANKALCDDSSNKLFFGLSYFYFYFYF